jgi:multidrug efflux pump subunit AcrA (membrane-fusion protein)
MAIPAFGDPPAAKKAVAAKKADKAAKKTDKAAKKTDATAKKAADEAAKKAAEAKKAEDAKKAAPAAQKVKKGLIKITLELDGVLESENAQEIAVRPDEWSSLTVLHAAPHGAYVRKGDVVLELDPEKLDRAITDLRKDMQINALALQQTEQQLSVLEKTTPMDMEAGERAARQAAEDRDYYVNIDRPFTLKSTEFSLKSMKEYLEYEQEELRQLEKMYKADDITEETEAIVLKRGRDSVDRAKFSLESAQISHDHALKYAIPRRDVEVQESTQRRLLDWEKSKVQIPMELNRSRLELDKLRLQRSLTEDRLKHLLSDREQMTIKAPIDGIVYYGKINRGHTSDASALAESLRPRGGIAANQVVMTIVQPRPMCIRANFGEGDLHDMRPNLKGTATPVAFPDLRLPVTVDTTTDIPTGPGSFETKLTVDLTKGAKLLMPGMTCKVKLMAYVKQDALTVPPSAVVTDELDDQKQTVEVLQKDGTTKTRPVTVGRKTDKQVEILKGLSEGEEVVTEPKKG